MKSKLPPIIPLVVLFIFGHACSTPTLSLPSTSSPSTAIPSPSPTPSPLASLESGEPAAQTPVPTVPVEATPTQLPKYFTEEWEGKTTDWRWFSTHGDDNLWDVYNEAGVLVFYLTGKDTYAYFIYNPWDYEKVQVSTQIEIRSKTKSTTVIVCDYSDTIGWYEFNIGSDGLWEIRAHDTLGHTGYVSLISGGSKAIDTGEGVNEYTATCTGNHLTLSINGTQALDFTDKLMKFSQGKIGLGILSNSQVPILAESAWVKISQP